VSWDWREDKHVLHQVSDIAINRINVPLEQLVIKKVSPEALTLYRDQSGRPIEFSGSTLESSGAKEWVKFDSPDSEDINTFEILKDGKAKGDDLINDHPVHR